MTEQEIEDFFEATLQGEYNDHQPFEAVASLHRNGDRRIFEKASQWSYSINPLKRARCVDILSQLRAPMTKEQEENKQFADPIFVHESFGIVCRMIEHETDERALESELSALGHLRQDGSVETLVRYGKHTSKDIRFAVAWALGCFPNDSEAIESLIRLSDDPDDDIRDWSLFAIGTQSELDTPQLRDALARHIDDSFADAKEEAIAGLAKRKDERAVLPVLRLMQSGSYSMHNEYDFEALVGEERNSEKGWTAEEFIDALYDRYPHLLPPR